MNNMNQVMQFYQQFRNNPMQMLKMRYNIPSNVNINNPSDIIQHLLNTGQVNQAQVNQVMGMDKNPVVQQLMQMHF